MHLVGLRLHPIKEALHSIPRAIFPELFRVFGSMAFAVEEPILVIGGEVAEGLIEIDSDFGCESFQVCLAFLSALSLEGLHASIGDREGAIGDSFL